MLSVVICTFNEEQNLPRVVASVKNLADEIVVVDTESTDKTVEIAQELGCRVFYHQHVGIIEPVRNFAVSKAQGDWILLLDADEEVSPELASEIIKIKLNPTADYYRIPRQNIIFGKWIKSDHWWPDYTYRLFKKGSLIWQNEIHSLPKVQGHSLDLKENLIHHNYQSISQFLMKLNTYTDFQTKELLNQGTKFKWTDLIRKPFAEFISQYYARRGYRDHLHGLALALLQAFSELIVCLKLWENSGFKEETISVETLQSEILPLQKELKWWQTQYRINHSSGLVKLFLKLKRRLS